MESNRETHSQLVIVQQQLSLARTEIFNLRKEIKNLKYQHSKDIDKVSRSLETWRCPTCCTASSSNGVHEARSYNMESEDRAVELKPIGLISTDFIKKRAVPRQPALNLNSHGKISLFNSVFTNPEHSLEGLEGFSHMWILFHFHKNMSSHIQAKVSPPRLNGTRVGVFGTRSPHRPCPIGLSLVQIEKIEGSNIYFNGVDMMDGTPVLDLKPYIPHYDNPTELNVDYSVTDGTRMERLELDGQESDEEVGATSMAMTIRPPLCREAELSEREAPDGQEGRLEASPRAPPRSPIPTHRQIRVPEWISQGASSRLQVTFTPQAECSLTSVRTENNMKRVITDILREDPRSVYLRDRYGNQFYTFLINNYHISCKFDDSNHSVKVFRAVPADKMCECGQPEWQCSIHSAPHGDTQV